MRQGRPATLARHGMVAAPHYLAAQAGLDLLKAGGNAVDAAIAASATLQVVYPFVCGLGGDVFMLLYDAASGHLHGLNGSGRAARGASIAALREQGHAQMPTYGIHTVTVPGCADGWGMAATRFGKLGLAAALQPAIQYAEAGFAVGPDLHSALTRMSAAEVAHPSWRAHFTPTGTVPAIGEVVRFPTLAASYRAIAAEGAAAFYRGDLAATMADFFAREGGFITREDLAEHHGDWVQPLSVRYAGHDIYELPPNTQGITALQMLGMLDGLPLGATALDPQTLHAEIEAKKLAFADRDAYLTDPTHMRIDPQALIAPDYLAARRSLIDLTRAAPSVAPGGFTGDTVYLCAADEAGNVVSLIQSNYMGFGSGVVVDGTGIVLQNRGAYFSLDPSHTNALVGGKRTLHTLIPSLALRDGKPSVVFGSMGGDGQPQTHAQVYTAVLRYGLNMQAAIELPRWVHGAEEGHETVRVEERLPSASSDGLRALGHDVQSVAAWDPMMGYAQGITFDAANGVMSGGSDPRAEGCAAGW
ncbi:MAG: gamma-glutamyltransferase [Ktedonobacterales bacterium]|nr:gamma-glutamyltransferase [Ktedonobacterales bacterium]